MPKPDKLTVTVPVSIFTDLWGAIRGLPTTLATILEKLEKLMSDSAANAGDLVESLKSIDDKVTRQTTALADLRVAATGIRGDLAGLKDIIAKQGEGSMPAEDVARVKALIGVLDGRVGAVTEALESAAADATALDAETPATV
jgi:ElaB/YqjD/DUF883 family membrane-anchored ribosome-binding protein